MCVQVFFSHKIWFSAFLYTINWFSNGLWLSLKWIWQHDRFRYISLLFFLLFVFFLHKSRVLAIRVCTRMCFSKFHELNGDKQLNYQITVATCRRFVLYLVLVIVPHDTSECFRMHLYMPARSTCMWIVKSNKSCYPSVWYAKKKSNSTCEREEEKIEMMREKIRDNLGIDPWRNGISVINWHLCW